MNGVIWFCLIRQSLISSFFTSKFCCGLTDCTPLFSRPSSADTVNEWLKCSSIYLIIYLFQDNNLYGFSFNSSFLNFVVPMKWHYLGLFVCCWYRNEWHLLILHILAESCEYTVHIFYIVFFVFQILKIKQFVVMPNIMYNVHYVFHFNSLTWLTSCRPKYLWLSPSCGNWKITLWSWDEDEFTGTLKLWNI